MLTITIEKALLDFGKPTLEKVIGRLDKEYDCYLPDCYEHPEYLAKILKDLYGNGSIVIIKSILGQLEEFNYQKPIEKFL